MEVILPERSSRRPGPAVDRTRPPVLDGIEPVRLPAVQRHRLSNGLDVLFARRPGMPVVDLHLVVRSGAAADPIACEGTAALVAELADEGSATRSALELADAFERLGAHLTIDAGWDGTTIALHVLRQRLESALELFAEVVVDAVFPDTEVRRKRDELIATLVREEDEPAAVAGKAFAAAVYGSSHRYGVPLHGTRSRVAQLDRDSLVRFHAARYRPRDAFLVAAGDVDSAALGASLEQELGRWRGHPAPERLSLAAPVRTTRAIHIVDRPGAPQSEIRVGHAGPPRRSPDYFPLLVLNTMLGGSFTSRLNQKLREEKGFAYGARSTFAFRADGGPFLAGVAVFTGDTAEAVADTLEEIRRIRDEGPAADELERVKRYLSLGLARRFETVDQIAAMLADAELHGLGDDYYHGWADRVGAVTAEDVQRAAADHLDPEHATVVVVGDRARIMDGLQRLDAGPVTDMDDAVTAESLRGDDNG